MTKKHYLAIAAILGDHGAKCHAVQLTGLHAQTCCDLADYFATDNPRFDRARFLQACGVEAIDYHPGATYKDCATNEAMKDAGSRHYSGCHACGYTGR